jgi:hypothetical protein
VRLLQLVVFYCHSHVPANQGITYEDGLIHNRDDRSPSGICKIILLVFFETCSTLPFMYQTSIEGIRSIIKECWYIYESTDNNFQRLAALKLAKECHESMFNLADAGPSVMYLKQLQDRLSQIEN